WAIHESFDPMDWLAQVHARDHYDPYIAERFKSTLASAPSLIFEASATSELFATYSVPSNRKVITYGVDIDGIERYTRDFDRRNARSDRDIPQEATVILAVGTVEERKAQAALIEAFAHAA